MADPRELAGTEKDPIGDRLSKMSQDLDCLKDDFHYVIGNRGYLKAMQTDENFTYLYKINVRQTNLLKQQFDLLILLDRRIDKLEKTVGSP